MALNKRQLAFIDEYLINGLNATRAARKLKYANPNVHGSRMLANDSIRAEIDRRLAEKKMSANEVLARLSDMAMSNIADFADIQNSSDLKKYRNKTHVIKKFKKKVTTTKAGDTIVDFELELYGADSALVNLGRHYKLFTDSLALTDWRTELIEAIKQGKVKVEDIPTVLGDNELAREFIESSGLQFAGIRENQPATAEVNLDA